MRNTISLVLITFGIVLIFIVAISQLFPPPDSERWNKKELIESNRNIDYRIEKIGECDYVFWFNGYGSDMEHYNRCETCLERN